VVLLAVVATHLRVQNASIQKNKLGEMQ
jgi:hypothetical protein